MPLPAGVVGTQLLPTATNCAAKATCQLTFCHVTDPITGNYLHSGNDAAVRQFHHCLGRVGKGLAAAAAAAAAACCCLLLAAAAAVIAAVVDGVNV